MSKGFTTFLGVVELAAGLGVAFGVFTQLAALGLIPVTLGAIQKKIFVWHTFSFAFACKLFLALKPISSWTV